MVFFEIQLAEECLNTYSVVRPGQRHYWGKKHLSK